MCLRRYLLSGILFKFIKSLGWHRIATSEIKEHPDIRFSLDLEWIRNKIYSSLILLLICVRKYSLHCTQQKGFFFFSSKLYCKINIPCKIEKSGPILMKFQLCHPFSTLKHMQNFMSVQSAVLLPIMIFLRSMHSVPTLIIVGRY